MGHLCSKVASHHHLDADPDPHPPARHSTQSSKSQPQGRPLHQLNPNRDEKFAILASKMPVSGQGPFIDASRDIATAGQALDVHDKDIASRNPSLQSSTWHTIGDKTSFNSADEYFASRQQLIGLEKTLDFDFTCRYRASPQELRVDSIIKHLKLHDEQEVYGRAEPRLGHEGQWHTRFAGDHFLSNIELINQTALFDVARRMPKGAHLHIHFNSCLLPHVLLDIAKDMDCMFITSNIPLTPDENYENFQKAEIQFSITCPDREKPGDLFSPTYRPRGTMRFNEFLRRFSSHFPQMTADEWLRQKLIFKEQEVHNLLQTASGAWEKFNGRTRMMKGLFNYETAYRRYTRLCLEDFMRDNLQYAEVRPNFMTSNQLWHDDGSGTIDNWGIMDIIIDEVKKFKVDKARQGLYFAGLKVIYCTPRSFDPEKVRMALDECIGFKKKWPEWIAGFDLVGEEASGRPLKAFVKELLDFRRTCQAQGLDIPFLFHCGETLDMGGDTDGNLVDALLLNSKRIGHGFALAKHPYIMQLMKARGICLELCPISNEVLGLTPRVNGHTMYQLLANDVHCTVSSDNGTLFRSTLSHDFYQVMIGKADMGLFGWKQLILWSIEHACLDEDERKPILLQWEGLWGKFLDEIEGIYGAVKAETAVEAS